MPILFNIKTIARSRAKLRGWRMAIVPASSSIGNRVGAR
jgi:hypothetical protein